MRSLAAALLALATMGASWIDPHATAREASRLYADGKFAESTAKYREALVDDPDSALLHFNAGAAAFRDGKLDDAVAAFGAIPSSDAERARTARTAYNIGNAKYRLGAAAEASKPQQALTNWAEALVAYRRAMGADPTDEDSKFNHELVEKKIADLKKKLEEQQKEKEQQQQQQQQQKQDQQQQNQDQQQQGDQQEQQEQQKEQQQDAQRQPEDGKQPDQQQQPGEQQDQQQQAGDERQQPEAKPDGENAQAEPKEPSKDEKGQPAGGDAVAGGEKSDEMSPREAEAILDGQRDQEVRPDEIVKRLQGARVAEPGEDW